MSLLKSDNDIAGADASEASDPPLPSGKRRASFGPECLAEGGVRFRLWAPGEEVVHVRLAGGERLRLTRASNGWHEATSRSAGVGTRYAFELGSGLAVPDPASRFQPDDVHGESEVVDPNGYRWTDSDWRGRPWRETVLYELHVGTFTPEGTFRAAIGRLDDLVDLGVTAIELMPLADFAGRHNWGYDGVLLYAPDSSYGRPDDLKALVDAAHARGLMVFLDVVYNHFGPEGNYIGQYAPAFYTERHKTPWGAAINYDGPDSRPVRDFMIENALYWLEEFHFDGLRLDAVHAIVDDGPTHILDEIAIRVRTTIGDRRHVHLVLENDAGEAFRLDREQSELPRYFTAQWNDDLHHCLHVAATGENGGYYGWYAGRPDLLGRALAEGFAYQGEIVPALGQARGEPSAHLPPAAFVSFLQNHDQVGNRVLGDRIAKEGRTEAIRAVASLYLLGPQVPMLFMGEEWATTAPFPYFCDFEGDLAEAIRKGRMEEFAHFPEFREATISANILDPTAPSTFQAAKLKWEERAVEPHAGWLRWYKAILAVRREAVVPFLKSVSGGIGRYAVTGRYGLTVAWTTSEGTLRVDANLSDEGLDIDLGEDGTEIWREGTVGETRLGPWSIVWRKFSGSV